MTFLGIRLDRKRRENVAEKVDSWIILGQSYCEIARISPHFDYLYGSFNAEELLIIKRQRANRVNSAAIGPVIRPITRKQGEASAAKDEQTPDQVEHLLTKVNTFFKSNKSMSLN